MPLKHLDLDYNYLLTVVYRGKVYTYKAKMYHITLTGTESWYVRTKSRLLTFEFDLRRKKLKQVIDGNESRLPEDLLKIFEKEFEKRE